MMFSDLLTHEDAIDNLRGMARQNRLSHALLLLGPEGSGALPLALAFAQYMVCENKQEQDSCGRCAACVKAASLMHPDIHLSFPVIARKSGDKPLSADFMAEFREYISLNPYGNAYDWLQFIGAENKQGNISALECSQILHALSLKSFESPYKIQILWMPEYLGKEGNRLLKLMEEPPDRTLFLLVAERQEQILSTILSRTQLLRVPPMGTSRLRDVLVERSGLTPDRASQIALLSEGNYREALELAREQENDYLALVRDWMNALMLQKPELLQTFLDQVTGSRIGRENQKQFLRYFINLLEHALRLRFLGSDGLPLSGPECEFALRFNRLADTEQAASISRELDQASYHIERNAHARLLFHALSIRLQHILSRRDLPLLSAAAWGAQTL